MTTTTHNAPFARRAQNAQKDTVPALPNKPISVQNAPIANQRKKPVTWKDLTIKYMLSGVEGIRSDLDESGSAVESLDKVIEELSSGGKDTKDLKALRDHYASLVSSGQPGRQPVKIGDTREYNVQQAGEDGDLFVRVPLSAFNVQRGQKVAVAFGENEILISRLG